MHFCKHCEEEDELTEEFLDQYREPLLQLDILISRLANEGKLEDLRKIKKYIWIMWQRVHPAIHEETKRRNTPS